MFKTVSQEVKRQRLGICSCCNHFNISLKTCSQCGCYMPAKTLFANTACPLGKWTENQPGLSLINKIEEAILESWNKN
jgi:hypothetical protein